MEQGKVAVNICDLDECNSRAASFSMVGILLAEFCSQDSPTFFVDKNMVDTGAIILDGPAAQDQERLVALVELLQTVIGPRKIGRRIRVYVQGPKGGWKEYIFKKETKNAN